MRPTPHHPPHPLRRTLAVVATGSLMLLGAVTATAATAATTDVSATASVASTASAATTGTEVTVDAGWQLVTTDGGLGGTSVNGPFVFHADRLTKVTVTDSYCHGDVFTVLDQGVSIGETSTIPEDLHTCPTRFYLSDTVRADVSMMDPTFSQGTFYVAPGTHALDLSNSVIWNDTDAGSVAFFRLETVSLTKTDCKLEGWKDFGTLFQNQGQCVSLAVSMDKQVSASVGAIGFATSPFGTAARGLTPPSPDWHKWTGAFRNETTYTARRTTPITQADPGSEVLTVTVPVSLNGTRSDIPRTTTVTLSMTPQPRIVSLLNLGQYGSLGNTAWELVGEPTLTDPGQLTTWTFRSTAPITPGVDYAPIVISFDHGNGSAVQDAVYNFSGPSTAMVSATAEGYATGTGSGWFRP